MTIHWNEGMPCHQDYRPLAVDEPAVARAKPKPYTTAECDALIAEKLLRWVPDDRDEEGRMHDARGLLASAPDIRADSDACLAALCALNRDSDDRGSEFIVDTKSVSWFPTNWSCPHDNTEQGIRDAVFKACLRVVQEMEKAAPSQEGS